MFERKQENENTPPRRGYNSLVTPADVNRYIARLMRLVKRGKLTSAQGQALSSLARTLLAGMAQADGHERLARVEQVLGELLADKRRREAAQASTPST